MARDKLSSAEKTFIVVEPGAGSGRVIAASTDFQTLRLEEIHRFDNPGTDLPGGSFWNILGLYREILEGLRRAVERHGESIVSIGIDTRGCDYGLIAANAELLSSTSPRKEAARAESHQRRPQGLPRARSLRHAQILQRPPHPRRRPASNRPRPRRPLRLHQQAPQPHQAAQPLHPAMKLVEKNGLAAKSPGPTTTRKYPATGC